MINICVFLQFIAVMMKPKASNSINGTIPSEIGELTQLTSLKLRKLPLPNRKFEDRSIKI
jgi:hypothetical protein